MELAFMVDPKSCQDYRMKDSDGNYLELLMKWVKLGGVNIDFSSLSVSSVLQGYTPN